MLAFDLCGIVAQKCRRAMVTASSEKSHGLRVILGCFILLGAPVIAAGIAGAGSRAPPPRPRLLRSASGRAPACLPPTTILTPALRCAGTDRRAFPDSGPGTHAKVG